ncbi:MAG: VWA domain-containing protein [Planctomycetes bacterium]|nr:VWA domain-containing protein [Planctomycetota bacterium]
MSELKMKMRLERETALAGSMHDAYLFVEVEAPKGDDEGTSESNPLEVALVIDVSGSMRGAPLEAAKQAAEKLVAGIGEEDKVTLVTFDSEVKTVCELMEMSSENRAAMTQAIQGLQAGSMTALHGGWRMAGRELLRSGSEALRRIVLLSDGHANVGATSPHTLGREAAELAQRGVYTTCVGIGDGYSTVQLQALAESGGGRLHDAERPHEIVEVVTAELREVVKTTAENVRLELGFPARAHVTCLSGYPGSFVEGAATFQLGSMMASSQREAVLRLRFSERYSASDAEILAAVRWRRPGEGEDLITEERATRLCFDAVEPAPRTEEDATRIAKGLLAHLVRAVTELNRERDWRGLRRLAKRELLPALELCEGHDSLHRTAHELIQLFAAARRPLRERPLKEMAMAHYKGARMERDYRLEERAHWANYLSTDPSQGLSATIEDVKKWIADGDTEHHFGT